MARRRFQRGTVYQNRTKTQWLGEFYEYVLGLDGVEQRKKVRLVLSPAKRDDGTAVRKSEAKNLLQPHLNRVNQQSAFAARERKSATFAAFADTWESDYLVLSKPSTQSSARTHLRILKAEFGTKEMRSIDAGDVQRLIARMTRDGKESKTIRNVWGTISLIWQAALAQKYVDAVLPKPKLPKNVRKAPRYFTLAEAGKIIAAVNGPQRCLYWLLAETGIRAGELSGLRLEHVALDSITVSQSVWGGKEQTPKTQNSVRRIAISPELSELIWGEAGQGNGQVNRQRAAGHSFLFTAGNGSPLDMNVERSRRLAPLLDSLEVPNGGYHAFRHFNVSLMGSLSVPLKAMQERIGHARTGNFTLDVYGHQLDWKANERAATALARAIGQAVRVAEENRTGLSVNSDRITTHNEKGSQAGNLEALKNQ